MDKAQIQSPKPQIPNFKSQVSNSMDQDPRTKFQDPNSKFQDPRGRPNGGVDAWSGAFLFWLNPTWQALIDVNQTFHVRDRLTDADDGEPQTPCNKGL